MEEGTKKDKYTQDINFSITKFDGKAYGRNDTIVSSVISFFSLEFTPCKAEQPLPGMELQEAQKD